MGLVLGEHARMRIAWPVCQLVDFRLSRFSRQPKAAWICRRQERRFATRRRITKIRAAVTMIAAGNSALGAVIRGGARDRRARAREAFAATPTSAAIPPNA